MKQWYALYVFLYSYEKALRYINDLDHDHGHNYQNFVSRIYIIKRHWCVVFGHYVIRMGITNYAANMTHWDRVTYICVSKLISIDTDNGLSLGWHQAIIWANVGILLTGPLGTNFNEILIEIRTFSLKEIHLKMSSGKWLPSCLGLNVLIYEAYYVTCTVLIYR